MIRARVIARRAGLPAFALAACASVGCSSYQEPTLNVARVDFVDASPDGRVYLFTLDADNPNSDALPLRTVKYTLSINGQKVFEGQRSPEATLRRFGTQKVQLPVSIPANLAPAAGTEQSAPELPYRLEGEMTYIIPGGFAELLYDNDIKVPTMRFERQGTLTLNR